MSRSLRAPLGEIEKKVYSLIRRLPCLWIYPGMFQQVFVGIAREKSPSASFREAYYQIMFIEFLRGEKFIGEETMDICKLVRWLAVIRRDYGPEQFERVVKEANCQILKKSEEYLAGRIAQHAHGVNPQDSRKED